MATIKIAAVLLAGFYGVLARVGYHCLWQVPLRNGAGAAIVHSRASGRLPDGTLLLRSYTGIPRIDRRLEPAVVFYHGLLDRQNPAHRLLLVEVHTGMQATALCMLAIARRSSAPFALFEPAFWGIVNQAYGAAVVYPLYMLLHAHDALAFSPLPHVSRALVVVAAVGAVAPAAFIFPAYVGCSPALTHRAIALYRFSPPALVLLLAALEQTPLLSQSVASPALPLLVAAAAAALGHVYALLGASTRTKMLRRVFWPDGPRKGSIADAAHLFLQYDVFVMAAAFVPYAYLLLDPLRSDPNFVVSGSLALAALLVVSTLVVGPGAVLALALAARCA